MVLGGGFYSLSRAPIDIFPDLARSRVTIMTECHGLAPEEVESLVTIPIESAVNGATGVDAVRSSSTIGLSVVHVDFRWGTEIYLARQIVNERLSTVGGTLPKDVKPELGPVSSLMGQIVTLGMWSEGDKTPAMEVRTMADWVVRKRLLTIPGVAQVITMGGGRKQFQILVDPHLLLTYDVTLKEVVRAVGESNQNATGGFVSRGMNEFLIRSIGRVQNAAELEQVVVKSREGRSVTVRDIGRIVEAPQPQRGDTSVNGHPAVTLVVVKQPQADTRMLTQTVLDSLTDMQRTLPPDIRIDSSIFQQRTFIDLGIHNVLEALRDGAILVLIILFLFLMNVRTTLITLTAIPLSIAITGIIFHWFGIGINVMTLGGLAVAMGELVDDAIVDIENVYRRLGENARWASPQPFLTVVYTASLEVRSSIVYGTALVILVFLPLFSLSGMEGRMFAPLGVAYIVSLLASLLVSLTVTPVLGSLLLSSDKAVHAEHDRFLLRHLKSGTRRLIDWSMHPTGFRLNLVGIGVSVVGAAFVVLALGTDFLPPFDEGTVQLNVMPPGGASLDASNRACEMVDKRLKNLQVTSENPRGLVRGFLRRTGRAEMDEHAEPVQNTEYLVGINPYSGTSREETLAILSRELAQIPGIASEAEQPLSHLLSHMLTGVNAQIAIKLFGDDLDVLRAKAEEIQSVIRSVPGITPPNVEAQNLTPQIRIDLLPEQLALYGLTTGDVNEFIETALNGQVVSSLLDGQRSFDITVRLEDRYRQDLNELKRMSLDLHSKGRIPLSAVAKIYEGAGPNSISRERARRRISIRANVAGRDLGSTVAELRKTIEAKVKLPEG